MTNPLDSTVPAGRKPTGPGGYITGGENIYQENFWGKLRQFVLENLVNVRPKTFDYMWAITIPLAAGDNWIDQQRALRYRRAWAIVNHQYFDYTAGVAPTAVDYVYVNSAPIQAAGQGLWVYPNGGTISNPVGSGGSGQQVHVLPGTPGSFITFVQYA